MNQNDNRQKYFILVLIGFLVMLLDIHINTGIKIYPSYQTSFLVGGEFQYYTMNTFYGAIWEAFSNVVFTGFIFKTGIIGIILVAIGMKKLESVNRVFAIVKFMSVGAIMVTVLLEVLPFFMTGAQLTYVVLCMGIARIAIMISMGYFFVCGVCDNMRGVAHKLDRRTIGISWFLAVVLQIVVFVTTWTQLPKLTFTYNIIFFWTLIFFMYSVWKQRDYILQFKVLEEKE